MLASSSEPGRPCIRLRERVMGFPGPRPGRANPRILACTEWVVSGAATPNGAWAVPE
jgi:hypothetical protein